MIRAPYIALVAAFALIYLPRLVVSDEMKKQEGVLAAMQRSSKLDAIAWISIAFVAVRSVFLVAYLADKATLRSSMWALGMMCTTALMTIAIIG